MRRKLTAFATAVALFALITAVASADDSHATFDAVAGIGYVGLSIDPEAPTSVSSNFRIDNSAVTMVDIDTLNEMVIGSPLYVTECSGDGCQDVQTLLGSGAPLTGLHRSRVDLDIDEIKTVTYTLPTPDGDLPMSAQVLSGTLSGRLEGAFVIGDQPGRATGRTELDIRGSGDYVCFSPLPGPYEPCMVEQGQLYPIRLDVVDNGKFTLTADGSGSNALRADVTGTLVVEAQTVVDLDKLVRNDPTAVAAAGTLTVIDASARLQEGDGDKNSDEGDEDDEED